MPGLKGLKENRRAPAFEDAGTALQGFVRGNEMMQDRGPDDQIKGVRPKLQLFGIELQEDASMLAALRTQRLFQEHEHVNTQIAGDQKGLGAEIQERENGVAGARAK